MTPTRPVFFVSDLHLGARYPSLHPDREALFLGFLRERARDASHLFIVGDLFEFWMEYRSFVPKGHFRILAALEHLARGGVEVHYLAGNHDFNLGRFFGEQLGIRVHPDDLRIDLQGRKLLVLHGDGLARSDGKYRLMRKVFRHPLSNFLFRQLHPDWGMGLAHALSGLSRDQHGNRPRKLPEYEAAGRELLRRSGCDIVLHGHTHAAFVKQVPEGLYVNTGEWLFDMKYAVMEGGIPRIESWPAPTG